MQQQQQAGPPIDLKNTSEVKNFEGDVLFQQGVVLRTVSKFVMGTEEDALLPIPVPASRMNFFDFRNVLKNFIDFNGGLELGPSVPVTQTFS